MAAARREVPEDGRAQETFDGVPPGWLSALGYAELMTASAHS